MRAKNWTMVVANESLWFSSYQRQTGLQVLPNIKFIYPPPTAARLSFFWQSHLKPWFENATRTLYNATTPLPILFHPETQTRRLPICFAAAPTQKIIPLFEIKTPFWLGTKKGQALQLDLVNFLLDPISPVMYPRQSRGLDL